VWPDTFRNGATIYAFLWKGDPNAKPVQRIGLIIFAIFSLLLAVFILAIPFEKNFEDGSSIVFLAALIPILLTVRLLSNAFLRPPKHPVDNEPAR